MLGLLVVSAESAQIGPTEGTLHLVLFFLLIFTLRAYLFISKNAARLCAIPSPSSPKEIPFDQAIRNLEKQILEYEVPSASSLQTATRG